MTTERIDVLAVMDSIASAYQELGAPNTATTVRSARAAVADLIEAANYLRQRTRIAVLRTDEPNPIERFDAAVARVGGRGG